MVMNQKNSLSSVFSKLLKDKKNANQIKSSENERSKINKNDNQTRFSELQVNEDVKFKINNISQEKTSHLILIKTSIMRIKSKN